jgi:hypothetical protein
MFLPMERAFDVGLNTKYTDTGVYGNAARGLTHATVEKSGYKDGASVLPLKVKMKNPAIVKNSDASKMIFGSGDEDWRSAGSAFAKFVEDAKAAGHDGIIIKGHPSNANVELRTDNYVSFDPKNIRSRFAAFDPAKADSADLLAMNGNPALSMLFCAQPGNVRTQAGA